MIAAHGGKPPASVHAGVYASVFHSVKAVDAAKADDGNTDVRQAVVQIHAVRLRVLLVRGERLCLLRRVIVGNRHANAARVPCLGQSEPRQQAGQTHQRQGAQRKVDRRVEQ